MHFYVPILMKFKIVVFHKQLFSTFCLSKSSLFKNFIDIQLLLPFRTDCPERISLHQAWFRNHSPLLVNIFAVIKSLIHLHIVLY